jgi:hypothetical protein
VAWVAFAAGIAVAASVLATSVAATNWGGPRNAGNHCSIDPETSECVGENWYHNVRIYTSVPADIAGNVRWSIADYKAHTDLFMAEADPDDADLDVKVKGINSASITWWAATSCEFAGLPTIYGGNEAPRPGTRWCKPQVITFNLHWEAARFPGAVAQRDIACHELGHTVGLWHSYNAASGGPNWSSSCMVFSSVTHTTTTAHDRAHINARY